MRAPINALGPVAEDVIETLGFGYAVYGFVAALPIFLFGLMSPVVSRLLRRFSGERLFLAGLLLLIFGCWARGADDPLLFIAGTLVMGFGITQLNVLMPAVIKTGFKEKWPVMMSVYAALIGLSGTAGVALSTQLFAATADFSASLRVWAPAALPALLLLLSLRKGFVPKETAAPETSGRITSARLLFTLVAITGLQAAINSTLSLWLPSALTADGFTSAQAGAFVTTLLVASIRGKLRAARTFEALPELQCPRLPIGRGLRASRSLSRASAARPHGARRGLCAGNLRCGILRDAREENRRFRAARGAHWARAVRRLRPRGRRSLSDGRRRGVSLGLDRSDASDGFRPPLGALCGARRTSGVNHSRKPAENGGARTFAVL